MFSSPARRSGPHPRARALVCSLVVVVLATALVGCGSNPYDDPDSAASRAQTALEDDADASESGSRAFIADDNEVADPSEASDAAGEAPEAAESGVAPTSRERAVAAVGGKGQYLYRTERIGTPAEIVSAATSAGLSHLVIRAGNPDQGFYVRDVLEDLLPRAHAAGIKVVAYDGPALEDIPSDVARAREIAAFTSSSGDSVDAVASDIERTRAPNLDRPRAAEYARQMRASFGDEYPLIAIVMHPNRHEDWYPFAELASGFDVFSPMDYWTGVTDDGAAFVSESIRRLEKYGLPVSVIGQAYPIEGKGTYPPAGAISAALSAAQDSGAVGMSFWSWETTRPDTWTAITAHSW